MARLFDDAQEEYLQVNSPVVTAYPFAMACRFKSNDDSLNQLAMFVGNKDAGTEWTGLYLSGVIDGDPILAYSHKYGAASTAFAQSSSGFTANTWHLAAGMWLSASERHAYIDEGNKGSNTGTVGAMVNHDRTAIGAARDLSPGGYVSGAIAEAAVWDLTDWGENDAEREANFEAILPALAAGAPPDFYPLGLVAYWPLVDDDLDHVGEFDMIPYNTPSWTDHPPVICPIYRSFTEAKVSTSELSITIDKPAGVVEGDLMVVVISQSSAGEGREVTPPAGWAEILNGVYYGGAQGAAFYKVAGGSEPADYTFSWSTYSMRAYGFIMRFTGHDPSNPINIDDYAYGSSNAPMCPAVTTTKDNCLILRAFVADNIYVTEDSGYPAGHMGITVDTSGGTGCCGGAAYKRQAATYAGSVAFAMTEEEDWIALTIAIEPPSPPNVIYPTTLGLALTLQVPTIICSSTVEPSTLALALALQTPQLSSSFIALPDCLALALALQTPQLSSSFIALPDCLALVLTQQISEISVDITITPGTFELVVTLQISTFIFDFTVFSDALTLAAVILTPDIIAGMIVIPDVLALALTQQTSEVLLDATVIPSIFELTTVLQTPAVIYSSTVTPLSLALVLTQQVPSISIILVVEPSTLELATMLQTPTAVCSFTVLPDSLTLGIVLLAPIIDTGVLIVITPDTLTMDLTVHLPQAITFWADIPPFMHKDIIDPYSGGAWLWLIEVVVPGHETIRIARNTEDVKYGGENYDKFNLQIGEQMFSGDGSIPRIILKVFQDRNRLIENIINETEGALGAEVKLIRVCEKYLDTPVAALEADYDNLASQSDDEWVTFTLGIPNPLTQRFPLRIYSSSTCPWSSPTLFKGPKCQYTGEDSICTGTYEDCYAKGNAVHFGAELGLDPNVVRV